MKLKFDNKLFDLNGNVVSQMKELGDKQFCKDIKKWVCKYKKIVRALDEKYYEINDYENMMQLAKKKKNILKMSVLHFFAMLKGLEKIPFVVWLNGSYARNSCVYGSDIDINFCYPNEYFSSMIAVEELISIYLCEIFNLKYRDLVHPMGYSRLENNYQIQKVFGRQLYLSEKMQIHYVIRKNGLGIMKEIFELSRDAKDIDDHFRRGTNRDPSQEWLYTYEVIYQNNYSLNISKRGIDSNDFNNMLIMSKLKEELISLLKEIDKLGITSVSLAKINYRNTPLKIFYQYTIFSKFEQEVDIRCDISSTNISNELKKCYVDYRKQLMMYERYLESKGVEWSVHNIEESIDPNEKTFLEIYNLTRTFIITLVKEINRYGR